MTHFQLLDAPIIRPQSWTLADNPDMTFDWYYLVDKFAESEEENEALELDVADVSYR